ncbi:unnamed protein product [Meloidogyne enterolobii]|uniref:Uncharacterized protein n=1 Tax=Meloidogyne enterolobii TaxID=390850 RepID=A0ACB0ZTW4_MELEN
MVNKYSTPNFFVTLYFSPLVSAKGYSAAGSKPAFQNKINFIINGKHNPSTFIFLKNF